MTRPSVLAIALGAPPGWYAALAPGEWTDMPHSVLATPAFVAEVGGFPGKAWPSGIMHYSGAALARRGVWARGTFVAGIFLVFFGHGHAAGWGNEVLAYGPLDRARPGWHIISPGSPAWDHTTLGGRREGYPIGRHAYNTNFWDRSRNRLVALLACAANVGGHDSKYVDPRLTDQLPLGVSAYDKNRWISGPDPTELTGVVTSAAAYYDPSLDAAFTINGTPAKRAKLDLAKQSWSYVPAQAADKALYPGEGGCAVDPTRHIGVTRTYYDTGHLTLGVWKLDRWDAVDATWEVSTEGVRPPKSGAYDPVRSSITYDESKDRFLYWTNADEEYVYPVIPSQDLKTPWTVGDRIGGRGWKRHNGYRSAGVYNRFTFTPQPVEGVVMAIDAESAVKFLKLG
jgi:hypothetical protein